MLQVARNFEQTKGPTEQVNYPGTKSPSTTEQNQGQGNYIGTKTPPKFEQNGSQGRSNHLCKAGTCQYCAGSPQLPSVCPALNKRCSGERALGESDTFPSRAVWGHPFYPTPPRHTILIPLYGRTMKRTSLRWISTHKSMLKVSATLHKILMARWSFKTRCDQGLNAIDQGAVRYRLRFQNTARKS